MSKPDFYLPISHRIFRWLSFPLTPLFVLIKVSADAVTYLSFIVGLIGAIFIAFGSPQSFVIGLSLFYVAMIMDFVDGDVARITKTACLHGKYLDGIIDIGNLCALRLALAYSALGSQREELMWAGVVCAVVTPFHILIYDRYSAFARWINEEENSNIKPYIRRDNKVLLFCLNMVEDLQHVFLILSIFSFSLGVWLYFLCNIFTGTITVCYHVYTARLRMRKEVYGF